MNRLSLVCLTLLALLLQNVATVKAQPVDWAHLTDVTLGNLLPSQFASANATDLNLIPGTACTKLSGPQMNAISSSNSYPTNSSCAGLNVECIQHIPPGVFASVNTQCMSTFNPTSLAAVAAAGIYAIPPDVMAFLNPDNMAQLTTGCAGFNSAQMPQIGNSATASACSTLSATCFQNIDSGIIPYVSANCLKAIPAPSFAQASHFQVQNFTIDSASHLTAAQLLQLNPDSCLGFNAGQVAAFGSDAPYDSCSGLKSGCINQMTVDAIIGEAGVGTGVTEICLKAMTADAFSGFRPDQIQALPTLLVDDISAAQFGKLTATVCGSFSSTQVGVFGTTFSDACHGITNQCYMNIPVNSIQAITPQCVSASSNDAFSAISSNQLSVFSLNSTTALSGIQISQFQSSACSGFTPSQVAALNPSSCQGLMAGCVSNIQSTATASLVQECVIAMPSSSFAGFNTTQITSLTLSAVAGINATQVAFVPTVSCAGFQGPQVAKFGTAATSGTMCHGISAACFAAINANAFPSLQTSCVDVASDDAFSLISVEQVASIPVNAVAFISKNQFINFNNPSCAGFYSNQTALFGTGASGVDACAGIQTACMDAMDSSAINGISQACIAQINPIDFSQLTREQVSALSTSAVAHISASQMASIPNASFTGWLSTQVAVFPAGACTGISQFQFPFFTTDALGGYTTDCIKSTAPVTVHSITVGQMPYVPPTVLGALNVNQTAAINVDSCVGITSAQVQQFGNAFANMCSALSPVCIGNIIPGSILGFQPACVQAAVGNAFAFINDAQLSQLSKEAIGAFSANQIGFLQSVACRGFNGNQTAQLAGNCAGLIRDCISELHIDNGAIQQLQPACIGSIVANRFDGFWTHQVNVLSLPAVAKISSDQFASFRNFSCKGFDDKQVGQFGVTTTGACAGVSRECFHFINATSFAGLTDSCVTAAVADAFSQIDEIQISFIPATSIAVLTPDQVFALRGTTCSGFNQTQFHSLTGAACRGIKSDCVTSLTTDAVSGITAVCISNMRDESFVSWTGAQIAVWSVDATAAVNGSQIVNVPSASCASFSKEQVAVFGTATTENSMMCSAITSDCFSKILATSYPGFTADCISKAAPFAFTQLSFDRLAAWTTAATGALNADQLTNLNGLACLGFSQNQTATFGTVSAAACHGIQDTCVEMLSNAAVSGIQASCVDWLDGPVFNKFTAVQLGSLTPSAITHITASQAAYLNSNNCPGFLPTQSAVFNNPTCSSLVSQCAGSLSVATWGGITGACLNVMQTASVGAISKDQLAAITPNALESLTPLQMASFGANCQGFLSTQLAAFAPPFSSICASFQPNCVTQLSIGAVTGFPAECLGDIPAGTFNQLNIFQLLSLTPASLAGITYDQFTAVVNTNKGFLIDTWSYQQSAAISGDILLKFKATVENGNFTTLTTWTSSTNISLASSLQLADCQSSCLNFLLVNSQTARSFPAASWAGLRVSQMKLIGTTGTTGLLGATVGNIAWLNSGAWANVQSDAVGAVTPDQLAAVSPDAFSTLPIGELPSSTLSTMSSSQMQQVPLSTYQNLDCDQYKSFTDAQRSTLATLSWSTEQGLQQKCGLPYSSTAPSSSSSTGGSSTGPADSSSSGVAPPPEDPSHGGLSTGEKIGIGIGASAGAIIIAFVAWQYYKSRKNDPNAPFDPASPEAKLIPNQTRYTR